MLKSQIPNVVGGRGSRTNVQLLMLSLNLLKCQIPYMVGVCGGFGMYQPKFISNFQNLSPNLNFLFQGERGGVGEHKLLELTSCESLGITQKNDR